MKKALRRLSHNYIVCGELIFIEFNPKNSRGLKNHDSISFGGAALVDFDGQTMLGKLLKYQKLNSKLKTLTIKLKNVKSFIILYL